MGEEPPFNVIRLGDAFQLIKEYPRGFADLIIVDPPYNIASDTKLTKRGGEIVSTSDAWGGDFKDSWAPEEYADFMERLAELCDHALSPEGSLLIFFDRSKPHTLKPFYESFTFRNMIVFIKKNPVPHFRKNNYRSGFELCAWFSRDKYHLNFISQRDMVNVFTGAIAQKKTLHPTEKYEWMIQPLIERHSKIDDLVFDPMCGSGTVPVVARRLGRRFLGFEINPRFHEMAVNRLRDTPIGLAKAIQREAPRSSLADLERAKRDVEYVNRLASRGVDPVEAFLELNHLIENTGKGLNIRGDTTGLGDSEPRGSHR